MAQLCSPSLKPCDTGRVELVEMCMCWCVCALLQAGFNHDYGCVYKDVPEYEHLIRVLPRCFTEVMLRIANPLRDLLPGLHHNGPKGECCGAVLLVCWVAAAGLGRYQNRRATVT